MLGLGGRITEQLPADFCVPAVGQGVIGIECRADDTRSRTLLAPLHHEESFVRLAAERAYARALGGSCHSPIAAHATLADGELTLHGFVGAPDGGETYRDSLGGPAGDAESLGLALARRMQAAGAGALLERLRDEAAATP